MHELRSEAVVFGRYLVDREPSEALIDRYARANERLFGAPGHDDRVVLEFAVKHPWSLPMLDAAAGLTAAGSLLRKKLLVMTAIVETTPELVDRTNQQAVGLPRLAVRVGLAGARATLHVVTGLALTAVLRRRG